MADLSALLSPIINLMKRLNGGENPSSSQVAAVDRTLGTITTLGLTYAVCKLVANVIEELSNSQSEDSDNGMKQSGGGDTVTLDGKEDGKIIPSFLNLVHVICRGILVTMGAAGRESPRRSPSMADFEQSSRNYPSDNGSGEWRNFHGSCHCKSISFVLNAPAHITAKDCKGKIRYPHLTIESDQFQLTSGTRYLSVYYVRLPDKKHSKKKTKGSTFSWIPSTQTAGFDHHHQHNSSSHQNENIAAHTFCNRCGVHILRAPDSKSNRLEVNVNCFEELYNNINDEEDMNGAVHVETIYKEDEDGRGLGSGVAIAERLKTVVDNDAENESLEHDYSYEGGLVYNTNGNSNDEGEGEGAEWTSQFAYVEQQHKTVIHTPASTRSTSTMSASTPTASMAATSSGWNGFKPVVTRQHPGTPTTFDTSVVSASDSVTTTDELNLPTLEGGFSFDNEQQQQQQQQQHYFPPPPTNDDESDFPSSSSSLPSPSMNSNNTTIPGFRTFSTTASSSQSSSKNSSSTSDSQRPPIGPPPLSSSSTSAVTREQLKYYMKKHVSPVAKGSSNGSKNIFPTNPGS